MKNFIIFIFCALVLNNGAALCQGKKQSAPQPIEISGHVETHASDSLTLYVWYDILSGNKRFNNPSQVYKSAIKDGAFHFKTRPLKDVAYIEIAYGESSAAFPYTFFKPYIISPGSKIIMTETKRTGLVSKAVYGYEHCNDCSTLSFKGKGSKSLSLQWELDEKEKQNKDLYFKSSNRGDSVKSRSDQLTKLVYRDMINLGKGKDVIIKHYKASISPSVLNIIKANTLASNMLYFFNSANRMSDDGKYLPADEMVRAVNAFFSTKQANFNIHAQIPETGLLKSYKYISMCIARSVFESVYVLPKKNTFAILEERFSGNMRDQVLTKYLYYHTKIPKYDSLLNRAAALVKDQSYQQVLWQLKKSLLVGSPAYDFALPDSLGKIVRLSDFKGKVVLIDFYYTGCSGCSGYFQNAVTPAEKLFHDNPDVVFVAISIDKKDIWHKGLKTGLYTFPQGINLYTAGKGNRHPVSEHYLLSSFPNPLLVGKDGKVITNDMERLGYIKPSNLISEINNALH